jgi:hypothetical protein
MQFAGNAASVVAPSGVEPEHSCEYRNLNPTRLPIPPRGLIGWLRPQTNDTKQPCNFHLVSGAYQVRA